MQSVPPELITCRIQELKREFDSCGAIIEEVKKLFEEQRGSDSISENTDKTKIFSGMKALFKEKSWPDETSENTAITSRVAQIKALFHQMKPNYTFLQKKHILSQPIVNYYEYLRFLSVAWPREWRLILDPKVIEKKLEKQLRVAQKHKEKQPQCKKRSADGFSSAFKYQTAPTEPDPNDRNSRGFVSKAESLVLDEVIYDVGISQVQASRPHQEDRALASCFSVVDIDGKKRNMLLTGVFDGHGGAAVSEYMKEHLEEKLQEAFNKQVKKELQGPLEDLNKENGLTNVVIWNILKIAAVEFYDKGLQKHLNGGTTSNFSLLVDGEDLWTANVGDSRSFITQGNKSLQLSEDMVLKFDFSSNLSEEEFTARQRAANVGNDLEFNSYERSIWKRGGFSGKERRVNGMLVPARAIGDLHVGIALSSRSKVTHISLSKEFPLDDCVFLVQASDGLWDNATTNQVAEGMSVDLDKDPHQAARNLTYSGCRAGDFDNITTVVTKIDLAALRERRATQEAET